VSGTAHALEVESTEFVARHLWHRIRPLFARHLTPRCRRCILNATYAPLDASGLCQVCREDEAGAGAATPAPGGGTEQQREALAEMLKSHAGKGEGAADALVLVSGGKDSAYMVHRLLSEYPDLRIATLLVDNGFMSPFALENAASLMARFDVPYIKWKVKPDVVKTGFRYALTHLDRQSAYSIVDLMDACMTFDTAMSFAAAEGIPLVVCGLAAVQTDYVYGEATLELPPERYRRPLTEQLGVDFDAIFDETELGHFYRGQTTRAGVTPRFVLPFVAWDPSEDEVLAEVSSLGLIAKKRTRPLVTNNALIPVIGIAEYARFGFCSWEVEFARMVREGKSERRYWLNLFEMNEYAAKTGRFVGKTVTETLGALGLTRRDIGIEPS